ncbi:MAG: hypothetical protein AB8H86_18495 [Polyangiales bacterium]
MAIKRPSRTTLTMSLFICALCVGCGDDDTEADVGAASDGSVDGRAGDVGGSEDGGMSRDGGAPGDGGAGDAGDGGPTFGAERPDFNGDGEVNILVLGTTRGVRGGDEFAPGNVAVELESILRADPEITMPVSVVAEDIVRTASVNDDTGYRVHSMLQYYYWPEGEAARHANLRGEGDVDWDHVIIASDPRIVAGTPGYFALGVNKVAEMVRAGNAEPRLLMVWPSGGMDASVAQLEEFTYRAADGAAERMRVVPAGLAWDALPAADQDTADVHPTPNGAYLAAAGIYAQLYERSASESGYTMNDGIADVAENVGLAAAMESHFSGLRTHASAFAPGAVAARPILYHQTGTSTEAGIRGGFRGAGVNVNFIEVPDDAPFAHFNYGRANSYYEDDKRYQHDPSRFDYSFGLPFHHGRDADGMPNGGDTTMRYAMDPRVGSDPRATDLAIALYMADNDQLPESRSLPIRAMFAQAREAHGLANPDAEPFTAYRDRTHMGGDLNRASGAFLYTVLTGHCGLADEPEDTASDDWKRWVAHRTGYETAWTMMYLRRRAPGLRVIPESAESVSVTPSESGTVSISFANAPTEDVVVRITTDNPDVVMVSPSELTFTADNHADPQIVTMSAIGDPGEDLYTLSSSISSADPDFDGFVDRWEYTSIRP